MFEARRAIERSIVLSAAARAGPAGAQGAPRQRCRRRGGGGARRPCARRSGSPGEFHLLLAEAAGNAVLTKFLEELVARTSLIIGLYGSRSVRSCSEAEHGVLIDALAERDGAARGGRMEHHLSHTESALDIRDAVEEQADIRRVFAR